MKTNRWPRTWVMAASLAAFAVAGFAVPRPAASSSRIEVSVNLFYNNLALYGSWVDSPQYGYVWTPYGVSPDWAPYTDGQWVYSDECGWTWVSYEPWGWATCHYGRWYFDDYYNSWFWVPGDVWAPAWVDWRETDDYIGWCPLPPWVVWRVDRFDWDDFDHDTRWRGWSWVRCHDFDRPKIHTHIIHDDYGRFFGLSSRVTRFDWRDDRVCNRSFSADRISRFTGHPVSRYRLEDSRDPSRTHIRGDRLDVFRPSIHSMKSSSPPPRVSHYGSRSGDERGFGNSHGFSSRTWSFGSRDDRGGGSPFSHETGRESSDHSSRGNPPRIFVPGASSHGSSSHSSSQSSDQSRLGNPPRITIPSPSSHSSSQSGDQSRLGNPPRIFVPGASSHGSSSHSSSQSSNQSSRGNPPRITIPSLRSHGSSSQSSAKTSNDSSHGSSLSSHGSGSSSSHSSRSSSSHSSSRGRSEKKD